MTARGERGAALVVALWSAVILGLIGAGISRLAREDIALTRNLIEAAKADLAAESGVATALHALSGSTPWPADGEIRAFSLDGTEVRVTVTDEALRLDLNLADEAAFDALLRQAGQSAGDAGRLASAIIARRTAVAERDPAREADVQGDEGDDDDDDGPPAFQLVSDLLDVPGITSAVLARIADNVTVYGGTSGRTGDDDTEVELPEAVPADTAASAQRTAGTWRIHAEARTAAGAVTTRLGVFALGREAGAAIETRLWTRSERRLFPAPAY